MSFKKFGSVTINQIKLIEQKHNVKLPNDYINFLVQYNGGSIEFDDSSIYVDYLKSNIHVDVLLGINTFSEELDIDTWTNDYKYDMSEGMIIIGHSYEHGFFVLNCADNNKCISYWDHAYEFECSNDELNNYFIADTFAEFVKNIIG